MNMNKKNIIYIAIISAAFIGTAYFLYSGFSSNEEVAVDVASVPAAQAGNSTAKILPLGNKFDTSVLKKLNSEFNAFSFPQVTPDAIGITPSRMLKEGDDSAQ
jgi:hypothetical protein